MKCPKCGGNIQLDDTWHDDFKLEKLEAYYMAYGFCLKCDTPIYVEVEGKVTVTKEIVEICEFNEKTGHVERIKKIKRKRQTK